MRISSSGDILWQTNHGGNNNDTGTAVSISEDENLIVATGYSRTSSGAPFKFKAWGVDATNATEYMSAGAAGLIVGSCVFSAGAMVAGDYTAISKATRELVEVMP